MRFCRNEAEGGARRLLSEDEEREGKAAGLLLARGRPDEVRLRPEEGGREGVLLAVREELPLARGVRGFELELLGVAVSALTVRTLTLGLGSVLGTNCRCFENMVSSVDGRAVRYRR